MSEYKLRITQDALNRMSTKVGQLSGELAVEDAKYLDLENRYKGALQEKIKLEEKLAKLEAENKKLINEKEEREESKKVVNMKESESENSEENDLKTQENQ